MISTVRVLSYLPWRDFLVYFWVLRWMIATVLCAWALVHLQQVFITCIGCFNPDHTTISFSFFLFFLYVFYSVSEISLPSQWSATFFFRFLKIWQSRSKSFCLPIILGHVLHLRKGVQAFAWNIAVKISLANTELCSATPFILVYYGSSRAKARMYLAFALLLP